MTSTSEAHEESAVAGVGLDWLPRLRWGVVAAGLLALFVAQQIGIRVPLALVLGMLALMAATNLAFGSRFLGRATPSRVLFAVLVSDVVLVTVVLHATGAAENPMSAVYMLYVTLAAMLFGPAGTVAIVTLCALGYGSLFLVGAAPHLHHASASFVAHLYGMFGAFVITAALVAFFVQRLSTALRAREAELSSSRAREERARHLATLGTLSAGAAHELGTPLGTIAIVAGELEARALASGDEAMREDAHLIREETRRCRAILDALAERAGRGVGEARERVDVAAFLSALAEGMAPARRARLALDLTAPLFASLPPRALRVATENLVNNAFEAAAEGPITLRLLDEGEALSIVVEDHGPGMDEETLARAKEPFFTRKSAHGGMGLGLFLTESIAAELGGGLDIESEFGKGCRVRLRLPKA